MSFEDATTQECVGNTLCFVLFSLVVQKSIFMFDNVGSDVV